MRWRRFHQDDASIRVCPSGQKLLREQLANGPKRGELIETAAEAAEISERSLLAAIDELGVPARHGQWWLPGNRKLNI